MIQLSVNNQIKELDENVTVQQALRLWRYDSDAMLGVSINQTFVSRSDWSKRYLEEGDQVDILQPITGG